jgi:hypothetical protein
MHRVRYIACCGDANDLATLPQIVDDLVAAARYECGCGNGTASASSGGPEGCNACCVCCSSMLTLELVRHGHALSGRIDSVRSAAVGTDAGTGDPMDAVLAGRSRQLGVQFLQQAAVPRM